MFGMAGWKPFLFVLKGSKTISYFNYDNKAVAKGSFSIKNALVRPITVQGRQFVFEVYTEDRESILLEAKDAVELTSWMDTLTAVSR